MQSKTRNLMARCIFFVFTLLMFVFNVPTTATTFEENIITKNSNSLHKVGTPGKYSIKARVSAKDKTSLMSFNSSELRWTDTSNKSVLKKSDWTLEGNSYIWEPRDKSQFIKIPLRTKFTPNKNSPEVVNEIQIEYQDLFPNNPIIPIVKIESLNKEPFTSLNKKNLIKKVFLFKKKPFTEELLEVSSTSWIKKNYLYLIRRTLGINYKPNWRYSQDRQYTVLQRQLRKNLHSFDTIDIVLDEELDENQIERIICNFRISSSKFGNENIVTHAPLHPISIKALGKNIIRYKIGNFIQRTNLNTKSESKGLYLKELIIFLPGSAEDIIRARPVKSILFLKQNNDLDSYMANKERTVNTLANGVNSNRKNKQPNIHDFKNNISAHVLKTQTLSRDSKRLIINLPKMTNTTNDFMNLRSIDLFIRPTNPDAKSGFRLQRARKIIRNKKIIKSVFAANTNNFLRWGGPFKNLSPSNKNFEYIKINDFYPFENFNKNIPYESGKEIRPEISIKTNDNSLFRILNDDENMVVDFWFLTNKSVATLNISKLGSFGKVQNDNFDWRIEGPLKINTLNNAITPVKNTTDAHFLVKKNFSTTFRINPIPSLTKDNHNEIRGRLVLKNIRKYSQKNPDISQTLESDGLNKKTLIHSRGITIQTKEPIKQWHSVVNGLKLAGEGKWIEIDWPAKVALKEDTLFYFGISKGAKSISSFTIIPFNRGHQLKSISAVPNKSISMNLPNQNIDHLKIRIILHNNKIFNLVLREMALFQTVATTETQAIKLSNDWKPTQFIPSQLQSTIPTEVSIDNEYLKVTALPDPGHLETVRWRNIIHKKNHSIAWLKIEYRISKVAHAFNKCWLEMTWVGINQKIPKTICTRSSEGHILIPVNANYKEDFLESIHWEAHIGYAPNLSTIPVSFDFKVGSIINNDITSGNYVNSPFLKLIDKKIFPISLNNLTAKKIISNKNMLSLGSHTIDFDSLDVQKIEILNHPFLYINFLSLEKFSSNKTNTHQLLREIPLVANSSSKFWATSFIYKLLLLFLIILTIRGVWTKERRTTIYNWFIENISSTNQYRQQLLTLLVKVMSSIHNQATLLNRLFGLILAGLAFGIIIFNNIYVEYIIFVSTILIILGVLWNEFKSKNKNQKISPLIILAISCAMLLWLTWLLVYSDQSLSRFIAPFIVLAYFYAPWFHQLFSSLLLNIQKDPAFFWLTVAGTTYLIAFIIFFSGGGSFNSLLNIISIGHLAVIPYWSYIIKKTKNKIEYYFPSFAIKIYNSKENTYVAGFFIFVLLGTVFRVFGLNILSEQFSIIAFYLLVTGIALKIRTLSKPKTTPLVIASDL